MPQTSRRALAAEWRRVRLAARRARFAAALSWPKRFTRSSPRGRVVRGGGAKREVVQGRGRKAGGPTQLCLLFDVALSSAVGMSTCSRCDPSAAINLGRARRSRWCFFARHAAAKLRYA